MSWNFRQAGGFFLRFFLAQQALTLLLEIPLGLVRRLPELLMVMPVLDVTSDFAVLCLAASVFNALTSMILALLCAGTGLWSGRAEKMFALGILGGMIAFYAGDVLFSIITAILDNFIAIYWHELILLPATLASIAIAVLSLRTRNWPLVERRMRGGGIALCVLSLLLLPVPLARGVKFIGSGEYRSAAVTRPAAKGPNILFVVVDTMSAPAMSLYGGELPTTPRLASFARQGTVFDSYIATSNFTTPTVASMLSGQQPAQHGVFADSAYFMEGEGYRKDDLLPYVLRRNGYATGAVISNVLAHPLKLHIEDGFDTVLTPKTACDPFVYVGLYLSESSLYKTVSLMPYLRHLLTLGSRQGCRNSTLTNFPPEPVYDRAVDWLTTGRDKSRPFFLWVQTLPPHSPYLPPPPYLHMFEPGNRFTTFGEYYVLSPEFTAVGASLHKDMIEIFRRRYAEDMRYADAVLDGFLSEVKRRGLLENTIVIVTADHGEAFGRWIGHSGPYLDQDLVHVPLVVAGPGIAQDQRVGMTVSQADLAPTVLDLAHMKAPAAMQGRSLLPLLAGESLSPAPVFSMQSWPGSRFHMLKTGTYSVIDGRWKYVQYLDGHKEELFDLQTDKAGLRNVSAQHPEDVARLRNAVDQYFGARKAPYPE